MPDGVEQYASIAVTSFRCGEQFGYFADTETDCKCKFIDCIKSIELIKISQFFSLSIVFHVCLPSEFPDGKRTVSQYTFGE